MFYLEPHPSIYSCVLTGLGKGGPSGQDWTTKILQIAYKDHAAHNIEVIHIN